MAGRMKQLAQNVMNIIPFLKSKGPQASASVLDRRMMDDMIRGGVSPAEAAKLAVQPKKGGLITGALGVGAATVAANAVSGGGITNWVGTQAARIFGTAEQTQATVESLNAQTQGINWWTKILSMVNAIFPTEFVQKMIDDRLSQVATINKRAEEMKIGSYKNDGTLVGNVVGGIANNPGALLDAAVVGGIAAPFVASKMINGSMNPMSFFSGRPAPNLNGANGAASGVSTANEARSFTQAELDDVKAKAGNIDTPKSKAHASPAITAVEEKVAGGGLKGAFKKSAVGALIIGGITATTSLLAGGSKAEAAEQGIRAAVPFADSFEKAAVGDSTGAAKSATIEAAGWAGFIAGTAAATGTGAAIGASVGSVVPVGGTIVGGIVGGAVGLGVGVATSTGASYVAEKAWDSLTYLFNSEASGVEKPAPVISRAPVFQNDVPTYAFGA